LSFDTRNSIAVLASAKLYRTRSKGCDELLRVMPRPLTLSRPGFENQGTSIRKRRGKVACPIIESLARQA
jgi:hypothetical protein